MIDLFLGSTSLFLGMSICIITFFYKELSRVRDIQVAGLFIFLGLFLNLRIHQFSWEILIVQVSLLALVLILGSEILINRWNLLTEDEKNRFTLPTKLIRNYHMFYSVLSNFIIHLFQFAMNIFKPKQIPLNKKKWTRSESLSYQKTINELSELETDKKLENSISQASSDF
tara:strand:- start:6034 stop:6546 length:513 start_codon:yes stop_codon:yes gene_type:complete